MAENSKIEWTDATWNPTRGCNPVSPGCANCYAAEVAARFSGPGQPYEGLATRKKGQPAKWTGKIRLVASLLEQPLKWKKPRRIFVDSMSDLFHPGVPFEFVDQVFAVMAFCPQHTFQILTKRPKRMAGYFNDVSRDARRTLVSNAAIRMKLTDADWAFPWLLRNVWLGTSVENQKTANERIPHLLKCPAAVRFLSMEPLLGPVDLRNLAIGVRYERHISKLERVRPYPGDIYDSLNGEVLSGETGCIVDGDAPQLDWVIVGGESGPNARPMHPDWARSIRNQCQAAGVPFFYKQWGEFTHLGKVSGFDRNQPLHTYHDWPDGTCSRRVGKKAAGRLLDGREWNEFPESVSSSTSTKGTQ